MTIGVNELWIEIELNSSLLFGSGDAMPSDMHLPSSTGSGDSQAFANPVHVEGFTDNQPSACAIPDQLGAFLGRAAVSSAVGHGRREPGRMASGATASIST
ncbi:hypothetical protein GTA07_16705 [Rhodococcus hoagii]|nr:hypothetical protein [Prescottella equi]